MPSVPLVRLPVTALKRTELLRLKTSQENWTIWLSVNLKGLVKLASAPK